MSATTPESWSRLVAARDEALALWSKTSAAAEALGAGQFGSVEERLREEAAKLLDACEDRLLETPAPDLAAVALQLTLFAERFHCADLDEPMAGEDVPEGDILRRIRNAILWTNA